MLNLKPILISELEILTCSKLLELIYKMQIKRESCQEYMVFFEYLMNILNKALSVSSLNETIEKFTDLLIWNSKFSDEKHYSNKNVFPKNDQRKYEFIKHIANNYYRIYHSDSPKLYDNNHHHGSNQCPMFAGLQPTAPAYQYNANRQWLYRQA